MFGLNQGSGPVANATVASAKANIKVFAGDLRERGIEVLAVQRKEKLDHGKGRYAFELKLRRGVYKKTIEVHMPGIPVKRVRYMGERGQNILQYPRLYVDGSSWAWMYAIEVYLGPEEDAEE